MAINRERVTVTCAGSAGSATGEAVTTKNTPEGVIHAVHFNYLKRLAFTSGSEEPTIGDTISGNTGGATGVVVEIELSSGRWVDGDAAGNIWIDEQSGTFQSETLDNDTQSLTNIATIAADSTAVASTTDMTVAEYGGNDGPGLPIITLANNVTDGWYYPRVTLHDMADASAIVGPVDYQSIGDTLKASAAGANADDKIRVTLVWDDLIAVDAG